MYHEAAIPSVPRSIAAPVASHEANATGTLRVLEGARRHSVRRVVYAGSSSAYGETPTLPKVETMAAAPLSPYAVSKLAGEHYCQVYARAFGVETVVLRYFNVFGPRQDPNSQYAAVIPRFVTAALEGRRPVIFGDGTQSRDFCFIENVIEANLLAADARERLGAGVQRGLRAGHRPQRRGQADRRGAGHRRSSPPTRPGGWGTSSTPWPTSRRPGRSWATPPPSRSRMACDRTIEWYKRQRS